MADEVQPDPDSLPRKWWSDADDLSLLTQVNNDLPFKHAKSTAEAWGSVAAKLLQAPSFARIELASASVSEIRYKRSFNDANKQAEKPHALSEVDSMTLLKKHFDLVA
ncbi:hypothetical protein DYB32_010889 [Aphanomyces invadans]|uniref:Uncharacterized protein n=1 Tax=Aphanomyces invadans TaxID=157072 RepID=A0A3R6YQL8_9STRA|nr:hypothetical protein DYB32_010889 [Aphanomyces invadans]